MSNPMNRRGFIKLVSVAVLAPALPVPAAMKPKLTVEKVLEIRQLLIYGAKKPVFNSRDFDPRQRYGHALIVNKAMPKMRQLLRANMEKTVPPAYRKKVTWHDKPFDLGRRLGIGWIYNPEAAA